VLRLYRFTLQRRGGGGLGMNFFVLLVAEALAFLLEYCLADDTARRCRRRSRDRVGFGG